MNRSIYRQRLASLALIFLFLLCMPSNGYAQDIYSEPVKAKLEKQVRFNPETLGNGKRRTLRALLEEVNAQTDLQVVAESYLNDRQVFLSADSLSARDILASLAELEDWTWKETTDHRILVSRRTYTPPHNLGDMPDALRRCLPRDLRNWLGVEASSEDLYIPKGDIYFGRVEKAFTRDRFDVMLKSNAAKMRHIIPLLDDAILRILANRGFRYGTLDYRKWTPDLRELIVRRLVVETLNNDVGYSSAGMYTAGLLPFQADLGQANVGLSGLITIRSYHAPPPGRPPGNYGYVEFGVPIPEEQAIRRAQH